MGTLHVAAVEESSTLRSKVSTRTPPLGIYTADFYCIAAKLVIEVDGASHLTEEAKQHDAARDEWMEKQGIEILRFTCAQVEHEVNTVLKQIDDALMRRI